MFKRRAGSVFVGMGAVLLAAALLLFLNNEHEDAKAGEAAGEALSALQVAINDGPNDPNAPPLLDLSDPTEATEAAEETVPTELTVVNINGNDYIGYLSIPAFELELPVMADWSMDKLQTAPCLQYGSPLTDDAVIAAHNFKQHFRALHDIQAGERVTFTDMNGYVMEYTVADVEIIDPRNVYDVINSEYDLILYTCTTGGQSRVTVRCNRTGHTA